MSEQAEELTNQERDRYEWQMWTQGIGEAGQRKLKNASVLVSRLGGVGGTVAYYLAAAGIGRLFLAHHGNVKPSDLNRQLLMTTDWLGRPRVESARRRLNELNPNVKITTLDENLSQSNSERLIENVDIVVDAAPLFEERFAMNDACVRFRRPLIECAMYDFDAQLTTIIPGKTPCLRCLYPRTPPMWKRQFPVFGAVSGTIAAMAAVEVIKLITGVGHPLINEMLFVNLRNMDFKKRPIIRDPDCVVCAAM